MSTQAEDTIIIEPTTQHTHTVIFLHGRGSNAADFEQDFFYSSLGSKYEMLPDHLPSIKWVLPTATKRYSPAFQGLVHEWFDIRSLRTPGLEEHTQLEGIKESLQRLCDIVEQESKLVPVQNIFLGGISQGCATAIHALLMNRSPMAGFIGIAGWLPFASDIEAIAKDENVQHAEGLVEFYNNRLQCANTANHESEGSSLATPVYLCHGTDDGVVTVAHGRRLAAALRNLDMRVDWREDQPCGHWVKRPEAVDQLEIFLQRIVNQGS